jgi:hypothetical protein
MFGPQCYQRSDCKGEKWDWVHTHTVLHEDRLTCLESPRWDLRLTFLQVCHDWSLLSLISSCATYCCYTGCYWILCELHSLLLYGVLLDGLYATSYCYAGWGKDTWHSMFNMFLTSSDFWATLYILRMEVFLRELLVSAFSTLTCVIYHHTRTNAPNLFTI